MNYKPFYIPLAIAIILLPLLLSLKNTDKKAEVAGRQLSTAGAQANRPDLCDLLIKSPYEKAVNIVIMGDGFTSAEINNGTYKREVAKFTDNLLSVPPFLQYQNFINVFMVKSVSRDSGSDDAPGKDTKNTIFNSTYGGSGIQRLLIVQDYEAVKKWAQFATNDAHSVIILVNDTRHGGSGGYYSVASTGTHSFSVIMHELGHSLGGLADEYVDESIANHYQLSGAESAKNVSTTSNLKKIKWSYFIGLDGYDHVGAHEGAYYRSKGVWRPIDNCLMKSLSYGYCPVCREQISMKISTIAGIPYNFNDFREKDPVSSSSNELKITKAVNFRNEKITPYKMEDFDDKTETAENHSEDGTDSMENKSYEDSKFDNSEQDETSSYLEIYDYYEGSYFHLSDKQWEERLLDGTVNYFTEYQRDEHYIYMTDYERQVTMALAIRHLDSYIWDVEDEKWVLIYQTQKRE